MFYNLQVVAPSRLSIQQLSGGRAVARLSSAAPFSRSLPAQAHPQATARCRPTAAFERALCRASPRPPLHLVLATTSACNSLLPLPGCGRAAAAAALHGCLSSQHLQVQTLIGRGRNQESGV
ncbi:putative rho guanine nucleotide exchange factor 39 [Sesbania bispinosa]|nr:putative rho guanine nucleotide exchange factor 39 [Sesbania bispinosa]